MSEPYTEVIYVAGPYRSPIKKGVQHNIDRALIAAERLWKMGYVAICPHSNSPHFGGSPWWYLQGYLMLLRRCDAIYVLKGSQNSEGTQGEIREVHVQGLTVYYEGVNEPVDLWKEGRC